MEDLDQKVSKLAENRDFHALAFRNALYNTWLAGSIADASRRKIAFFKNWIFFGVLGAFLKWSKSGISRISKLNQYFDSHSRTKKASTFVKVSIESSENRAFDRALNEEASYFRSEMAEGILLKK